MEKAAANKIGIDVISFIDTKNSIDFITGNKIKATAFKETAVVFTSMNAAEAVIDFCKAINAEPEWTIYTLGGTTHTIIKDFFTGSEIFSDANNAAGLAQKILENKEEDITFFCGNQRRDELPGLLKSAGVGIDEIVVYETIETPVTVDKHYDGILFFSPSAVKSFFSTNKIDVQTVLFAIGSTTASALKKYSTNKVMVGSHPNKELLAEQAFEYFVSN